MKETMTHPTPEERAKERAKQIVDYAFGVYAGKPASERGDDRSFWQVAEDEIAQSLRAAAEQARSDALEEAAKECDELWTRGTDTPGGGIAIANAQDCARAIRSRIARKDGGINADNP